MTLKDRLDAYRDACAEFGAICVKADRGSHAYESAKKKRVDLESYVANLEKCQRFAQKIFELSDWPEGGDIDGFELQEAAEECGLLIATTPTEPCGESCNCLENNCRESFAQGIVTCYRPTEALNGEKE